MQRNQHLSADDSVRDLLNHPALAGFAHLILPWDNRAYDEAMRLRDLGSIMPYHSHLDPQTMVGALNRMIDDVSNDQQVYYSIYTDAQKNEDPTRAFAGLFFFRGKPGAPFAVIAPGGGFSYVASVHEGFPYAAVISAMGYNAFVLRYRAGHGGSVATRDLAAAVSYICRNASALGVATAHYSLWGSSAGARMAATIGSHGGASYGADNLPKPATVVMAYTGHSDHSSDEPPAFVVVGEEDAIARPSTVEKRVAALRKNRTAVEFHRYRDLGHGFGLGIGTSAEGWVAAAVQFWEAQMAGRLDGVTDAVENEQAGRKGNPT
jgi:acetyl esterase/lipase